MIISMAEILNKAKKGKYAVAAPNVFNRETIEAVFLAAKELRSPMILDVGAVHGIYECAHIARFYEKKYPEVPIALNLDHGGPYEDIIKAIHAGFSSVMIDRSSCPYNQNKEEVKEIVKIAHAVGISVEAELGHVGQGFEYEKTRNSGLTRPEEAIDYVKETGVDCLAVAVGTSHGVYKGTPYLDFDLLKTLANEVSIPLVLHGGSGTGDENLTKAVRYGIQKINLNTDLNKAGQSALKEALNTLEKSEGKKLNLQQTIAFGIEGWKEELVHYMKLFGSAGRW